MISSMPEPCETNDYLAEHVMRLDTSLRHWTGRGLLEGNFPSVEQARRVFLAPFIVVSHDARDDPIFTYGNLAALRLWEMSWQEFVTLPSRKSAAEDQQASRSDLLAEVKEKGFIDNYSGIRTSRTGRRFLIEDATLWNLVDQDLNHCGQAALFHRWKHL